MGIIDVHLVTSSGGHMTNKIRERLRLYELAPANVRNAKVVEHLAISRNAYRILNSDLKMSARYGWSSTYLTSFWAKINL